MDLSELASTAFLTLALGGMGSLMWARLNRIEDSLDKRVTREEFHASQSEMRDAMSSFKAEVRHDLAEHRRESREDIANLRSDLTAVALAVGAHRPKASEG